MKTVHDVKKAMDFDTMINVVYQNRKEAAQTAKKVKPQKHKNKWFDVFPACRV